MDKKKRYWVISPRVDGTDKYLEAWKEEIVNREAAILGWPPNYKKNSMGRVFAGLDPKNPMQKGDVVLIARGKKKTNIVGFGIVSGGLTEYHPSFLKEDPRAYYRRKLHPFQVVSSSEVPDSVPLLNILQHIRALVQKHPRRDPNAKKVFEWLAGEISSTDSDIDVSSTTHRNIHKSRSYDYKWRSQAAVNKARKREKKLTDDYERFLNRKGRQLSGLSWGRIECDLWEERKHNLIEAKASVCQEDIRMAVGQLFHYSFLGKAEYAKFNKAILLPKKPDLVALQWLVPLNIKLIWQTHDSFKDNDNGQFV